MVVRAAERSVHASSDKSDTTRSRQTTRSGAQRKAATRTRHDSITPRAVNRGISGNRTVWGREPPTRTPPRANHRATRNTHTLSWVRRLQGISRTCPPPALRASPETVVTRLAHVDCSANFPRRLPRACEGGVQTVLAPPATCSGPGDTVAGTLPAMCQQHVGGTPPATCQRRLLTWIWGAQKVLT